MRFKGRPARLAVAACAAVGLLGGISLPAAAQSTAGAPFISFKAFLDDVSGTSYHSYATADLPGGVRSQQAFNDMRSHILATYRGVKAEHSFILEGSYVDCVTLHSQPAVRDLAIKKITTAAPPAPGAAGNGSAGGQAVAPLIGQGLSDTYGNAISCPDGTIPMQRVTFSQANTLPEVASLLGAEPTPAGPEHRYAFAGQDVDAIGDDSFMTTWDPKGYFSLSQGWLAAGSGSDTQTVEGGWIKYAPSGPKPTLFIAYTSHYYAPGTWCYNLGCGFVQVNNKIVLGGELPTSTVDGKKYGINVEWYFVNDEWLLYVNYRYVGYYPATIFDGGPMSQYATRIQFGGETTVKEAGDPWPQMGNGKFAKTGPNKTAEQRIITYFAYKSNSIKHASLSKYESNPKCYTLVRVNDSKSAAGTYIYFGGPGGHC